VIYAGGMLTTPLLLLLTRRTWRVVTYPPNAVPADNEPRDTAGGRKRPAQAIPALFRKKAA